MESEKQELIEKYKPIELIKKWKPVLTYKFEDGKSVPNHAHQECAKELELLEKTYKNNLKYLQELIPFCVWVYKTGIKCGGGIEELLEEHPSLKQSLIDESNKVYDLHTFGQGYIGKKTPKEKIEEYKKHVKLNDNKNVDTEKQKFFDRINKMIDNGLKYIHFTPSTTQRETVEEEVYGELNRMLEAEDLPDPEVLGKFSI